MKKRITVLFLLLSFSLLAQDKAEIKEFFWGKNDAYKEINTVPDKWKNESAVIIYKYENHDYHNYRINVTYTSSIRKKILLLDEAAVTEFSEFSFLDKIYSNKGYNNRGGVNVFGVKIIKPNGNVVEIDVEKESVSLDNEKKIAIANLEVGDIIDFYLYTIEKFKSYDGTEFPKVERVLGEVYPILNYKLNFLSENDFFINFNSYNGAPQLVEVKAERSSDRKFELEEKNIEKKEFSRWLYPLADLPCYKFQVCFAKNGYDRNTVDAFLSDNEKNIKKTVSIEDVYDAYKNEFYPEFNFNGAHEKPSIFFKDKSFTTVEEKIRFLYYYSRYLYFIRPIEKEVAIETKLNKEYAYMIEGYNVPFYYFRNFMKYFTTYLRDEDISYDIIIGSARYNGEIKDLLLMDNVIVVLRINTPKPLYIEYYNPFSDIDILNPDLENTKAYVLRSSKSKTMKEISEIALPSSSVSDNVSRSVLTILLNSSLTDFEVSRESSFSGHFKNSEQRAKIPFYEFVKEDHSLYTVSKKYGIPKSKEEIAKNGMKALINSLKDDNKKVYENSISEEFNTKIEEYNLDIVNSGRYGINEKFQFKESFLIKNNFIKKAGDNYIIEIGQFLTSQVEINKKEIERKNDIFMPFPRAFENEIIFNIPTGYTIHGIEKLNKHVVNETGKFTSAARVEGDRLIIVTSKQYNNYFEPNSNWNKMIQFLDVAYQFTQEKILLKKS